MKQISALLLSLFFTHAALGADYIIDKEGQHAYIIFKASHLGYSYIIGHFEDFEGRFSYDSDNPQDSKVAVTIQVASLDSDHAERDKHLRGEDYFDAEQFPEVTFVSTKFEGTATEGKLHGVLNFRGIERDIVIDVNKIGEGKDPWGGYRSGFEGVVQLAAADYGLPEWIGTVDVTLIVEGIRQ